ncbi:hypothetical protein N7510_002237 [Penicillium lagena]|uniref:uncharacterized protein n=1 Tax=Penicillium lagena TaxID=94218 RepID=UPI00254025AA|nr:uncharacterized protein N7510_002237 [Penicillium lagena]KAJ5625928.1 hypothetical protein N7510_002237 [Penicillium lagena]
MTSAGAQTLGTGARGHLGPTLSVLQLAPSVPWAKTATASCTCRMPLGKTMGVAQETQGKMWQVDNPGTIVVLLRIKSST